MNRMASFYKDALRFTRTDTGDPGTNRLVFLSRDPAEHHQIVLATGRPNRLEIFMDTPWYCEQPLDFGQSDDAIMKRAEQIAGMPRGRRW